MSAPCGLHWGFPRSLAVISRLHSPLVKSVGGMAQDNFRSMQSVSRGVQSVDRSFGILPERNILNAAFVECSALLKYAA